MSTSPNPQTIDADYALGPAIPIEDSAEYQIARDHRDRSAAYFPMPSAGDCALFAATEIGEYLDALIRLHGTAYKRNSARNVDTQAELRSGWLHDPQHPDRHRPRRPQPARRTQPARRHPRHADRPGDLRDGRRRPRTRPARSRDRFFDLAPPVRGGRRRARHPDRHDHAQIDAARASRQPVT